MSGLVISPNRTMCIICGLLALGLIGLPSIIGSSARNPNFYLQALAQQHSAVIHGKRPNILLILSDDFGYSDIGAFGSQISTPNLFQCLM